LTQTVFERIPEPLMEGSAWCPTPTEAPPTAEPSSPASLEAPTATVDGVEVMLGPSVRVSGEKWKTISIFGTKQTVGGNQPI